MRNDHILDKTMYLPSSKLQVAILLLRAALLWLIADPIWAHMSGKTCQQLNHFKVVISEACGLSHPAYFI